MDFFDWLSVPQVVLNFVSISVNSADEAADTIRLAWIICLCVAAGLYLIGLLFGGFGLMTMAKRRGMEKWWLGFLPFGNTYLLSKLAGETDVLGKRFKRWGLWTMIAEIVFVLVQTVSIVLQLGFAKGAFYSLQEGGYAFDSELFLQRAPEYAWALQLDTAMMIISSLLGICVLFMFCFLYNSFFRKYYARSPMLMTILCVILPVRGFVSFAVRKNTPVDYDAYMRRRMEEAMRRSGYNQGGQGGYNQGGYNQGGYNQGGYNQGGSGDPFSEYGGSGGASGGSGGSSGSDDSPFSDF